MSEVSSSTSTYNVENVIFAIKIALMTMSSGLSILGSVFIMLYCRNKLDRLYHRLLFVLGVCSLIFSISCLLQPWLTPHGVFDQFDEVEMDDDEEEELDNGKDQGEIRSCTSIGFIFTVFALSVSLLNCCLSMYFRVTIVKGISEELVIRRYEKLWYGVSILLPIIAFGIVGIITRSYNANSYSNICSFHTENETGDSEDGDKSGLKLGYSWVGVLFVSSIIGFGSTYQVYKAVRDRARAMARYTFGGRRNLFSSSNNHHSSTAADPTTSAGSRTGEGETASGGGIDNSGRSVDNSNHNGCDDSHIHNHNHSDNNDQHKVNSDCGSNVSNSNQDATFIPVSQPPAKLTQNGLGQGGRRVSRIILMRLNNIHSSILQGSSRLTSRSGTSSTFSLGGVAAERVNAVATQAIMYSLAYLNSIFWPVMVAIVSSGVLSRTNGIWYSMDLMAWTFYPLQGFWNCLVYLRPTWVQWRKMYPAKSRLWVFRHIMELNRDEEVDENNNVPSCRTNTSHISRRQTGNIASSATNSERQDSTRDDDLDSEVLDGDDVEYSSDESGNRSVTRGDDVFDDDGSHGLEVVQEEESSEEEEDEEDDGDNYQKDVSNNDLIPFPCSPGNSSKNVDMEYSAVNNDVKEEIVQEDEETGTSDKNQSSAALMQQPSLRLDQLNSPVRASARSTRTSISVDDLLQDDSNYRRGNSSSRRQKMQGSSLSSNSSGSHSSHRSRRSGRKIGMNSSGRSSLHVSARGSKSQLRGSSRRVRTRQSAASMGGDNARGSIYVEDLQHRESTMQRHGPSQESFMRHSSLSVSAFFDLDLEPGSSQRSSQSSTSASYRRRRGNNSSFGSNQNKEPGSSSSSSHASSRSPERSARPMVLPESPGATNPSHNTASHASRSQSPSIRRAWSSFWNHSLIMSDEHQQNLEGENDERTKSTNEDSNAPQLGSIESRLGSAEALDNDDRKKNDVG